MLFVSQEERPASDTVLFTSGNNDIANQSVNTSFFTGEKNGMTNHLASLTWTDYFYLNALWLVNLGMAQVALEDKTVYLCQKSVITIKTQVRPVCSSKEKIWSQTDILQRCRRLPLEQVNLRQILENNSEGVLIWKWFDRWYIAESLCYRLRCKINHLLILAQTTNFFRTNIQNIHQDGSIFCQALTCLMIE